MGRKPRRNTKRSLGDRETLEGDNTPGTTCFHPCLMSHTPIHLPT